MVTKGQMAIRDLANRARSMMRLATITSDELLQGLKAELQGGARYSGDTELSAAQSEAEEYASLKRRYEVNELDARGQVRLLRLMAVPVEASRRKAQGGAA